MELLIRTADGRTRAARLPEVLEVAAQYRARRAERAQISLNSPRATREFLAAQLEFREHEVFCVLHLDNRHRLIAFDPMFRGTIDGASVHPREVVKRALEHNAAAVILAHNHPSGVPEPSQADELITQRLKEALALVDVRVLDHVIVGAGSCTSFAEKGLL
jgi:DNA repair protein RadC